MTKSIKLEYEVDGSDFESAGHASESVKMRLKQLGFDPKFIRRVAIVMYEGEINMVIHASGGTAEVEIFNDHVEIALKDRGKGIENIELAMQEGYSTAPDKVRSLGFGAGMGLPNMKKYSDEMKVESKVNVGTNVTMTVKLHEEERG